MIVADGFGSKLALIDAESGEVLSVRELPAHAIRGMRLHPTTPNLVMTHQMLNRFANITLKLWDKHGIKQAGFFTTLVGESNMELTYFLQWESLADREKKWNAFQADPEWLAKRAETEKDGAIVANVMNQFLIPTPYSSVK